VTITPRQVFQTLLVTALLFATASGAVLAAWHGSILPELSKAPQADRLSAAFARRLPAAPAEWPLVTFANVHLRLPVRRPDAAGTRRCAGGCEIALQSGRLRVAGYARLESFWETALLLAPDRGDASWTHSPWHHWSAILALSRRVRERSTVPGTWRFEARGARGVVSVHSNRDVLRHVVYAYSYAGRTAPPLLFTRIPTDRIVYVLSSLEFHSLEEGI
jgi:hypothetical protein